MKIVVFTGAGVSQESGIKTFRDSGGLWENYDINDVCTYQGWQRNMDLVLRFYNDRRKQLLEVTPSSLRLRKKQLDHNKRKRQD